MRRGLLATIAFLSSLSLAFAQEAIVGGGYIGSTGAIVAYSGTLDKAGGTPIAWYSATLCGSVNTNQTIAYINASNTGGTSGGTAIVCSTGGCMSTTGQALGTTCTSTCYVTELSDQSGLGNNITWSGSTAPTYKTAGNCASPVTTSCIATVGGANYGSVTVSAGSTYQIPNSQYIFSYTTLPGSSQAGVMLSLTLPSGTANELYVQLYNTTGIPYATAVEAANVYQGNGTGGALAWESWTGTFASGSGNVKVYKGGTVGSTTATIGTAPTGMTAITISAVKSGGVTAGVANMSFIEGGMFNSALSGATIASMCSSSSSKSGASSAC